MTLTRLIPITLLVLLLAACATADNAFVPVDAAAVTEQNPAEAVDGPTANPSGLVPDVVPPGDDTLGYLTFLPTGYDPARADSYPLFIMLHGAGLENVSLENFAALPVVPPVFAHRGEDYPFIVLMPHLGQDVTWVTSLDALQATLDVVEGAYHVDPDRVFLTGFSAGGAGALAWGLAEPDRFAALVSIAGYWPYDEDPTIGGRACTLADTPTWLVQSIADTSITIDEFQLVRLAYVGCGVQPEVSLYESATHQETFAQAYSDLALYDWLLEQERGPTASSSVLISAPRPAPDLFPVETDADLTPTSLGYLVSLPADYDPERAEPYPVLVLLHGSDSGGLDIEAFARSDSLLTLLQREPGIQPFVVVMPQALPGGNWGDQIDRLDDMLDAVTIAYHVDPARFSVAGFSMGAMGAWEWAVEQPDRFAALVPLAGRWPYPTPPTEDERLCQVAAIPAWIFHSKGDETLAYAESQTVVEAYATCDPAPVMRFTTYEEQSHLGTPLEALRTPELYAWLLEQSR